MVSTSPPCTIWQQTQRYSHFFGSLRSSSVCFCTPPAELAAALGVFSCVCVACGYVLLTSLSSDCAVCRSLWGWYAARSIRKYSCHTVLNLSMFRNWYSNIVDKHWQTNQATRLIIGGKIHFRRLPGGCLDKKIQGVNQVSLSKLFLYHNLHVLSSISPLTNLLACFGFWSVFTLELCRHTTMKRSRHHSSSDDSDNGSKQTFVPPDSFLPSPNIDLKMFVQRCSFLNLTIVNKKAAPWGQMIILKYHKSIFWLNLW